MVQFQGDLIHSSNETSNTSPPSTNTGPGISVGGVGGGQAGSFCSDSSLLDGKFSLTMGWGKKEDGQISKVLREVGMPIISNAQCRKMFR